MESELSAFERGFNAGFEAGKAQERAAQSSALVMRPTSAAIAPTIERCTVCGFHFSEMKGMMCLIAGCPRSTTSNLSEFTPKPNGAPY